MPYVLRRIDQGGGYVTPPGSERSYTRKLDHARRYPTRSAALEDACGNETIVEVEK